MTERYLVSGVQLGMLLAGDEQIRKKIIDEIINLQYIKICTSNNVINDCIQLNKLKKAGV